MLTSRPENHTTFVPTTTTPLHLKTNVLNEGFEIMNMEGRQEDENQTQVSDLDMGSLKANPYWHPSRDPTLIPFVPPTEIFIRTKEPIHERLRDEPASNVFGGRNSITGSEFIMIRQTSCPDHYQSLIKQSTDSEEDQTSYNTSETADILSDCCASTETILQGKGRRGLLRREITHMLRKKVQVFKRKGISNRGVFRIQSTTGCMA